MRTHPRWKLSGPVRDTLPYRAIPFEIVSQRGVLHPFALISCGIAQVSLRYPFSGGGGIAPPLRMLSKRGNAQTRGEGVSHPIGHIETPKTP